MTTVSPTAPAVPKKPKPAGGVNMFGPPTQPLPPQPPTVPPLPTNTKPSTLTRGETLNSPTLPDVVSSVNKHTKKSAPTDLPSNSTPKRNNSNNNYIPTDIGHMSYLDTNDPMLAKSVAKKTVPLAPAVQTKRCSLRKVEVNDFAPPEPNFGRSLMHKPGIEVIGKMIDEEIVYLKQWRKYLDDRTKIENSYYKTLLELHEKNATHAQATAPEVGRETFLTFPSFLDSSQQYIDTIGHSIAALNKDTLPAIRSLISSKKSVKELYNTQSNKLERERHNYTRRMEESRRVYCDLHRDVETARAAYSNAAKGAKQDKMKKTFLMRCHELVEAHNSYVLALRACDVYEQWHHDSLLPMFLNTFQRILMLQTDYYSSFYDDLVTSLHGRLDVGSALVQQLLALGTPLNGDVEYQRVIRERGGEAMKRNTLSYDTSLAKHAFIGLLQDQLMIQNRDVTSKLKSDLQSENDEHQRNKQSKHTELTYMDKAITSTQGGHRAIGTYPFDINELCRKFASIMLEMQMECYKQDVCQSQLRLLEAALGATDGVDIDDASILERAFPERAEHSKTLLPAREPPPASKPIHRTESFGNMHTKPSHSYPRPVTPPELHGHSKTSVEVPIEEEDWYFGEISRDEAEKLLSYDGDYLVRYSSGQRGFVISTRCKGSTKHFVVKKENGLYMFNKQGFLSVRCLLEHQQSENQPLIGEFYLVRAVTRNAGDKWEITEKDLDIMDKIGKGNFGYVYKGYMRSRSSHVAIKMCKSDALADQDEFLREAEILKQYRHPNIVEFIGVSQQAECIYIIMELMSGGDFLTFLRNKAIREKKHILSHMVLDVAEGMTYLSSKDCVHRDLAARNCLIGEGKSLKISDFGMSRQLSEGEYQMSTANKPLPIKWTAPEALHKGLYTCQSDVWSYGILLWETFSCGSTPYPGMDSKTAIEKLETGFRLPAPTGTPPSVYELMRQCWEYSSLDRPRFPQIVCSLQSITQELRSKNI